MTALRNNAGIIHPTSKERWLSDSGDRKAKELGLSKDELIKQYITKAITDESKKLQQEQRLALINSIKGKYADFLSSSDDFAQRKQEEIQRER